MEKSTMKIINDDGEELRGELVKAKKVKRSEPYTKDVKDEDGNVIDQIVRSRSVLLVEVTLKNSRTGFEYPDWFDYETFKQNNPDVKIEG